MRPRGVDGEPTTSPLKRARTPREIPARVVNGSFEWIVDELFTRFGYESPPRVVSDWSALRRRGVEDARFRAACVEAYDAEGLKSAAYFLCDQLGCVPFVDDDVPLRRACVTAYLLGGHDGAKAFLAELAK